MKPEDAWNLAYHKLELQLESASFDTWLRDAVLVRHEETPDTDGVFVLGVRGSYKRDMLQLRLHREIQRVLWDVTQAKPQIRYEALPDPEKEAQKANEELPLFRLLAQKQAAAEREAALANPPEPLAKLMEQPKLPALPESELNPRFIFPRFVVNGSNQMVFEAAQAIVDYPATVYNPFLVYGGVGLGKTHMLQAIAHAFTRNGLRAIYIPSEVFTNDLINAIRNRTTAMFREKYRNADVLLVDDIQFISGKESTQEEFFHTFNALINFNKQIVLASDRHPSELATLEDRLRSRFVGGLVADIQPPELETRVAILRMWAQERDVQVSGGVIEMVAQRAPNNIRELEGIFNQIIAQSRLSGSVSVARAETTIERFRQPREHIAIATIIAVVAQKQNLSTEDLLSKRRTARISQARQIAMYLAREITDASLPQIGDAFGGRSHTTVLHGYKRIEEQIAQDQAFAMRVQGLHRLILTQGGNRS